VVLIVNEHDPNRMRCFGHRLCPRPAGDCPLKWDLICSKYEAHWTDLKQLGAAVIIVEEA
jgi:hypothetical protein